MTYVLQECKLLNAIVRFMIAISIHQAARLCVNMIFTHNVHLCVYAHIYIYIYTGGERKSSPPNRAQKGIHRASKAFFPDLFCKKSGSKIQVCGFSRGSWRVREVREADRNHFHLSWYL